MSCIYEMQDRRVDRIAICRNYQSERMNLLAFCFVAKS